MATIPYFAHKILVASIVLMGSMLVAASTRADSNSEQGRTAFEHAVSAIDEGDSATLRELIRSNPVVLRHSDEDGHNLLWYALVRYDADSGYFESDFPSIDALLDAGGLPAGSDALLADIVIAVDAVKHRGDPDQILAHRGLYFALIDRLVEMGASYEFTIDLLGGGDVTFSARYIFSLCDSDVFTPSILNTLSDANRVQFRDAVSEQETKLLLRLSQGDALLSEVCVSDRLK